MAFFGRRASASTPSTSQAPRPRSAPARARFVGRKFTSEEPVERSIEHFKAALTQQTGAVPTFFDVEWSGPAPAPERLVGFVLGGVPPLGQRAHVSYLALWPDGRMYFVAHDYEIRPTPPLVGLWKTRDGSLSSVGSVAESEFRVVA